MFQISTAVGPVQAADGSTPVLRAGRLGELFVSDSVGKYYELCRRGQLFSASLQAPTALGTALTATAVTFTLYNPAGSGVNVVPLQCGIVFDTLEATTANALKLVYAANVNTAAAAPTATTSIASGIQSGLLGGGAGQAKVFTAATLPAAPTVVRVFPLSVQPFTTATNTSGLAGIDYIDGAFSLAQNTAVTIQELATTTGNSGIISMLWAEIPV